MSDTIEDSIQHARISADALDGPDDIDNRAILHWMQHHVAFRHHHHRYVIVTRSLPLRWRDRAVRIFAKQDALPLLRPLKAERTAMAGLRRALDSLAPAVCATDDGVIDLLAAALADRRAWLFEDARKPGVTTRTDAAVYAALNGAFGSNVDAAQLGRWEGNQYLRGYVPFVHGVTAGSSGMTVGTGFDVGQISELELGRLDLPAGAGPKLAPFAGLRFTRMTRSQVAEFVARHGPVPVLTKAEADAVDLIIFRKHLAAAVQSWNRRRQPGVPEFRALPSAWQTVLFSRTYHQGTGMPDTAVAQPFYTAATAGHWSAAVTALQNYAVPQAWYRARVAQEAALLRTQMPPPVVTPNASGM